MSSSDPGADDKSLISHWKPVVYALTVKLNMFNDGTSASPTNIKSVKKHGKAVECDNSLSLELTLYAEAATVESRKTSRRVLNSLNHLPMNR